ncbi:MAG: OsmC family protein [Candidatus Kapabacteria bacterium]|nr:OsmC family protein [Candidatus Kapabacteria bacterium]
MVEINIEYLGDLRCEIKHVPSGSSFKTDAPADNQGLAEFISPTDMIAGSFGACYLTTIGIAARTLNIDIRNSKVKVFKEMAPDTPRRIGRLIVEIYFPDHLNPTDVSKFEKVIRTCPVAHSINPNIELITKFFVAEKE